MSMNMTVGIIHQICVLIDPCIWYSVLIHCIYILFGRRKGMHSMVLEEIGDVLHGLGGDRGWTPKPDILEEIRDGLHWYNKSVYHLWNMKCLIWVVISIEMKELLIWVVISFKVYGQVLSQDYELRKLDKKWYMNRDKDTYVM